MGIAERMGLKPARSLVQTDALDHESRVELWNLSLGLSKRLGEKRTYEYEPLELVTSAAWAWWFKKPRDEQPSLEYVWRAAIKPTILEGKWIDVLDLIEALLGYVKRFQRFDSEEIVPLFVHGYNQVFESDLIGYRFLDDGTLVPLDSKVDLDSITSARENTKAFKGARHHLEQAATLLSDRKNPDYPNSIKESISAVESVCVEVTREQTLGAALKKLQGAGVKIHPALEQAWSKMYGWTSDASGIRHGSVTAPDADQSLAKYMLITCSAFVSLVIESGRKASLI